MTDSISQLRMDVAQKIKPAVYRDEDLAYYDDIRELPDIHGTLRLDMFIIVSCLRGRLTTDINAVPRTMDRHDILVCRPNDRVDNTMISPDFEGQALCVSPRLMLDRVSENGMWDKVMQLGWQPVVHFREEDLHLLEIYVEAVKIKSRQADRPHSKEAIISILRAASYEILNSIEATGAPPLVGGIIKQRDVLFKRFIDQLTIVRVRHRSIKWYADRLCVTPKHLSNVSKQVSGKTALVWINEFVMSDIRHLLKHSDKSIKEIADQLQFPSISFFGKYCRQHFGCSPTEYRKRLRSGD